MEMEQAGDRDAREADRLDPDETRIQDCSERGTQLGRSMGLTGTYATSAGPNERAGFALAPEMGASSHTSTRENRWHHQRGEAPCARVRRRREDGKNEQKRHARLTQHGGPHRDVRPRLRCTKRYALSHGTPGKRGMAPTALPANCARM